MESASDPLLRRPGPRAFAIAALYLVLSLLWRIAVEGVVGIVIVASLVARGIPFNGVTPEVLTEAMSPIVLALASIVQLVGLGAIALVLARWLRPNIADSFGWRRASGPIVALAALGGMGVGFFPGWLAQEITSRLPWLDMGNLEMLNDLLTRGGLVGRGLLLFAIVVVAPVVEELVFRGFLWKELEGGLPGWMVWGATSALFAVYHVDPVHVIAVFFTGLFLGWLRLVSGSVVPSMAAHFTNNALAAILVLAIPVDPEGGNPAWGAALSLVVTVAIALVVWRVQKRTR